MQSYTGCVSQSKVLKSLYQFCVIFFFKLLYTVKHFLFQVSTFCLQVPTINATAFGVSFKEWKFCQFELDKLRHINWMKCPACDDHQHSVHMDGNMKLYRFKSAGM